MTHAETVAAIHLSLLLGDTRSERHGVYRVRRPRVAPVLLALSVLPVPAHVFTVPDVHENERRL